MPVTVDQTEAIHNDIADIADRQTAYSFISFRKS